jgi:hypothetical protein
LLSYTLYILIYIGCTFKLRVDCERTTRQTQHKRREK